MVMFEQAWMSTQSEAVQHAIGLLMTATMRLDDQGRLEPVFGEGDQWYFCDETWTDALGPYPTEQKAQEACTAYAKTI
jgi:hypothetical protein